MTVQAFMRPLLAAQKRRGHDVALAFGPEHPPPDDLAAPVHIYPIRRGLSPMMLLTAARHLAGIYREGRFDVIVAHMVLPGLIGRAAFALAGRPGRILYASHGLPCYPTCKQPQRTAALLVEKCLGLLTDEMTVLNRHDYDLAVRRRLVGPRRNVHLLPSVGIDLAALKRRAEAVDRHGYRAKLGLPADAPLVCYAGRFIPAKGVQVFIEIARQTLAAGRKVSFAIAGTGPLDRTVRDVIDRNGLGASIKMLGWYDDVTGLLAASDVLCFPTFYEGAPVIVQEAMACGAAVLTTRVPGPEDLIDDGVTGLLVEPGDADAATTALARLLDDPAGRTELTAAAQRAADQFDLSVCVPQWIDVIEHAAQPH